MNRQEAREFIKNNPQFLENMLGEQRYLLSDEFDADMRKFFFIPMTTFFVMFILLIIYSI